MTCVLIIDIKKKVHLYKAHDICIISTFELMNDEANKFISCFNVKLAFNNLELILSQQHVFLTEQIYI